MSEQDKQKITERILALLRLAGNNPSEEEASAAAAKAQELMLRHSIELAQVAEAAVDAGAERIFKADMAVVVCDVGGVRASNWRAIVGHALAYSVGGKAVRTPSWGVKSHGTFNQGKMTFFASAEVLPGLVGTFHFLDLTLTARGASETRRRPKDYYGEYLENARTWRNSWLEGCGERVSQRLRAQRRDVEAQTEGSGTALAVITTAVDALVKDTFPRLTVRTARSSVRSAHGYQAGKAAGDSINLGGASISGGSRRELNR